MKWTLIALEDLKELHDWLVQGYPLQTSYCWLGWIDETFAHFYTEMFYLW